MEKSLKYLEAVVSGLKPEILSRIAQATAAVTNLNQGWKDSGISIESNVKLMHFLSCSGFCMPWKSLAARLRKKFLR